MVKPNIVSAGTRVLWIAYNRYNIAAIQSLRTTMHATITQRYPTCTSYIIASSTKPKCAVLQQQEGQYG